MIEEIKEWNGGNYSRTEEKERRVEEINVEKDKKSEVYRKIRIYKRSTEIPLSAYCYCKSRNTEKRMSANTVSCFQNSPQSRTWDAKKNRSLERKVSITSNQTKWDIWE